MLADPLNNSNDYRDIIAMFDEMMEAHAPLLPQFYPARLCLFRRRSQRLPRGWSPSRLPGSH